MFAMDESPANREGKNRAQGNEEQEDDDYMGDLSQFLPSDALFPPKLFSKNKTSVHGLVQDYIKWECISNMGE